MSKALAFKRGTGIYSKAIKDLTGGEFSHVELWLYGPRDTAQCYSSRESAPVGYSPGTEIANLDLSDAALWEIVPLELTTEQEARLYWFCRGSSGRPYDYLGIAGIGVDLSHLHVGCARFCSNEVVNVLQQTCGLWPGVSPWMVAPSGFQGKKDRYGLFEMASKLDGRAA